MARLEFAILQHLEDDKYPKGYKTRVVLQRDHEQLLERLQARVKEQLILDVGQLISKQMLLDYVAKTVEHIKDSASGRLDGECCIAYAEDVVDEINKPEYLTENVILDAIDKAFNGLIKEFKDETIRIV